MTSTLASQAHARAASLAFADPRLAQGGSPKPLAPTMQQQSLPRVLCVDDEPQITRAVGRVLRGKFTVVPAHSAAEGLQLLRSEPEFAVVLSDYQMPETDGVTFLQAAREIAPDSVRVLLTGRADLTATVAAVNQGQIFRFVSKPVPPDALLAVIVAANEQHRLLTAERVLLEQTLYGSIKALISLLSLVQPAALGKTSRVKRQVSALATQLAVPDRWSLEIAALLSLVGCVTLPDETMNKLADGQLLSKDEAALVARLPAVAESLIAGIPRLEAVREILRFQDTCFDGSGSPVLDISRRKIPLGSRILKVVLDCDLLEASGLGVDAALNALAARIDRYDPEVLAAYHDVRRPGARRSSSDAAPIAPGVSPQRAEPDADGAARIRLSDIRVGMIFASDVRNSEGVLLVARGQEVTQALIDRVSSQWASWADTHEVAIIDYMI
jgi:response regulator RpfG family c-di-GMP phosphodiesterase